MEFCFVIIFIILINNKIIQRSCCDPEIKKEAEEKIDNILDNYLVHIKDEDNFGKKKHESEKILLYKDKISNNNKIENDTYENSKNNNISNNIINNNYYYINSSNFNNCCGYYSKSNEAFSNNTQEYTLSLLKKKNKQNKLKIKNIFGNLFKENFVLTINEYGIESFTPLRKQYDRITKFGPILYDKEGKSINDFPIIIPDILKDDIETLFTIEYNTIKKKYILFVNYRDDNPELNIFIKLEKDLPITQKYLLSLGDVNFSVEPKPGGALELEMNMENGETESYLFGIAKENVKIGRSKDCDIILKSLAYSRIQNYLYYKEDENIWYIYDGYNGKKSMNGTWLFINFPFEISSNTKLRVGKNLLELRVTQKYKTIYIVIYFYN